MRYSRVVAALLLIILFEIINVQSSDILQNIEPQKIILAGGNNPFEITKTIGTFDGLNNVLPVMVELKHLGRFPMDIGVVEYVDNNKIINCSGYKIISTLLEIYNDTKLPAQSIQKSNPHLLQFYIPNLLPKNRVRFVYYIDTNKQNNFQTRTTVRFYSEEGFPDSDYLFEMSTLPAFDITLDANKVEMLRGDAVDIKYNIKYLGPAELGRFNVTFDASESYAYDSSNILFLLAKKGQSTTIIKRVIYLNEGKYPLPGITISGKYYSFNSTSINVVSGYDVLLGYKAAVVSSVLSAIVFFSGIVAIISFFKRRDPIVQKRIRIKKKRYYERIKEACSTMILRIIVAIKKLRPKIQQAK